MRDLRTLRAKLDQLRLSIHGASITPARRSIGNMASYARGKSDAGLQKTKELRQKSIDIWYYMNLKKAEVPEAEGLETVAAGFFTELTGHDGPMMGFLWARWGLDDTRTCIGTTDPPKLLACFWNTSKGLATGLRDSRRKLIGLADAMQTDAEARAAYQNLVTKRNWIVTEITRLTNAIPPEPDLLAYYEALLPKYVECIEKWDLFLQDANDLTQQALALANQALDSGGGFDVSGHISAARGQMTFHRNEIVRPFGGYTSVLPFLFSGMDGLANGLALAKQEYEKAAAVSTSNDDCDQVGDPLDPPPCRNARVKRVLDGVKNHVQALVGAERAIEGLDRVIAGQRPQPVQDQNCIASGIFCRYNDSGCGWGCGDCGWGGSTTNDCSRCCNGASGGQQSFECPNTRPDFQGQIQIGYCR